MTVHAQGRATQPSPDLQRARQGLVHLLTGRAASAVMGLVIMALLWRQVSATDIGAFLALAALLEGLYLLSGLGLSTLAQRDVPLWVRQAAPGSTSQARGRIGQLLLLRVVMAALAATAVAMAWGPTTRLLELEPHQPVITALGFVAWVAVGSASRYIEELLTGLMQQGSVQWISAGGQMLRLAVLAIAGTGPGISMQEWVMLDLCVCAAAAALGWMRLSSGLKDAAAVRSGPTPAASLREAWRIGLRFWWVQVLGLCWSPVGLRLAVAHLGGPGAVALYGSLQAIADSVRNALPLTVLSGWVRTVMLHLPRDQAWGLCRAVLTLSLLPLAALVALTLAHGELGLTWLGGPHLISQMQALNLEWPQAWPLDGLLPALLVVMGLQTVHLALSLTLVVQARPAPALQATWAAAVLAPLLVFGLWERLGLWSVPLAVGSAEALWTLWVRARLQVAEVQGGWSVLAQHLPASLRRPWDSVGRRLRQAARGIRDGLMLMRVAAHDAWSFARGSGLITGRAGTVQSRLLKTAHRLEKGLALPRPRAGFGIDALRALDRDLQAQEASPQDWAQAEAVRTLQRYRLHHRSLQAELSDGAQSLLSRWAIPAGSCDEPQPLRLQREVLQGQARAGFDALVTSRRSIRQFGCTPVTDEAIEHAVHLARHSPSVCNRSGARVWAVRDAARRRRLLQHQNGHHGFAEGASVLLVVSVRPDIFDSVSERHQGWVDGGLFAMTLILALHHQGLGTCCLNWSVMPAADAAFKQEAGLERDEMVVMLLAVGSLPTELTVAHSPRRPMHEVLAWLEGARP